MNPITAGPGAEPVRVMIVGDSALMRKLLSQVLARDPGIEVVDTAMDGQFALDHLARIKPDVVLMDVKMPRLDGLSALERIVADYGLPVVMCSAWTKAGAEATIEALARGVVDFIEKPTLEALTSGAAGSAIAERVRHAKRARVRAGHRTKELEPPSPQAAGPPPPRPEVKAPLSTGVLVSPGAHPGLSQVALLARRRPPEMVALGTSTGGPPALAQVLGALPADFPLGLVIVQHMPPGFTQLLAAHLDRTSQIQVREAVDGEAVEPGRAGIAPGHAHLRVVRAGAGYVVALDEHTPPVSGHRPSVDVLFESLALASLGRAAAVVMTGMGNDGAEGLGRLAALEAVTIAQTPDSCICHGMPKSAIERGHARAVVALEDLASAIIACGLAAQGSSREYVH